jgi:pimeloyl-ACP methyl ester carboxylesterase
VPVPAATAQFEEWQIALHGRRAVYRIAGSGPAVVLIHGMLNSSSHWHSVAMSLAREQTVLVPDLIGHGDSAAPRGDYSLGAHAASIRDVMAAIGIDRASIVGHSLGGGVAMQFFYQFPQRVERLALISSGGLGREVSPMLRTAALPGFSTLLSATIRPRLLRAIAGAGRNLREREIGGGMYLQAALAGGVHPRHPAGIDRGRRLGRGSRSSLPPLAPARQRRRLDETSVSPSATPADRPAA